MKKPLVLSFFTGAGGLDAGFIAAGFKIACCVELEEWACNTLRANHPNTPVMGPPYCSGDIKDISAEDIYQFANLEPGQIDVMIGGPPCQPFSQAATQRFMRGDDRFKRLGFEDDLKGTLLFDYVRLILDIKPRVFVIENVPGLKTVDGGAQLRLVLDQLQAHGYHVTPLETSNAANYGAPQFRERLIIWGSRTISNPALPTPTHAATGNLLLSAFNTVAHALAGMPTDLQNHVTREHSSASIARYRTLDFGQREQLGRVDRLDPRKPSKTVIAGGTSGGGRSHLHPFIARTLSVRECARLQTFDDEFIFTGSSARQFTQVGNAVPPLLAEHFARQIMQQEFGVSLESQPLHHGSYLQHPSKSLDDLVNQLLEESLKQKPEWIYLTHSALVELVPAR